ncbi:baseplate assembly protein [Lelliottia aquatilis]|uniref:Baseplate assembly protein n=1 Tax=Lelliottia aquatilis TaxID=2080838 RepID=A0ABX5A5M5_9ENTR|nr:baseplate assembly protein [Lelliottia aquatilis]POZ27691.1 baseplate assembly protein [Lelliottia sp. 7254-16]POZ30303.1 baseplate assembly protein [Lelliottia aquatilis]POZ35867.1 baseplate assembly protein [Lelliottia aquatilis]POZ39088.1 baseplate assembly protein [Lelliottia aquatilis]
MIIRKLGELEGKVRVLYRKSMMAFTTGKVTAMKDAGGVQVLQYQHPVEVRGSTPRMAEFGFSSGLPAGTDVLIACIGGDRSSGIVIATNNSAYRHNGLNPGETVIYNQWGQFVKLTQNGIEVQANGQAVDVKQATQVTIEAAQGVMMKTPLLQCTGDIQDNCEGNTTTLKSLREAYIKHDHDVEGVESGNSTKTTEPTKEKP